MIVYRIRDTFKDTCGTIRESEMSRRRMIKTKLYSVEEVAEMFGVTPRVIKRRLVDGKIPAATKVGHSWVIPEGAEILGPDGENWNLHHEGYRGPVADYIAACQAEGRPATIPPDEIIPEED